MKKLLFIFLFLSTMYNYSTAPSLYLFNQQISDGCRVIALLNLFKLRDLTAKYGVDFFAKAPWYEWHTQREYFGRYFLPLYHWVTSLNLLEKNPNNFPHLYEYLRKGTEAVPTEIGFYDDSGKKIEYPWFLMPILHDTLLHERDVVTLKLPLVLDQDNKPLIYNTISDSYEEVEVTTEQISHTHRGKTSRINNIILSKNNNLFAWQYDQYNAIDRISPLYFEPYNSLNFKEVAFLKKYPFKININKDVSYAPGHLGRYKLFLLRLGVDENNEDIKEGHALYKTFQELHFLCNKDPNNGWSDKYCKKEDCLQYVLAKIFKENIQLFEDIQIVCEKLAGKNRILGFSYGKFKLYKNFIDGLKSKKYYHDVNLKEPYIFDEVKSYLPGLEQMYAHLMTNWIYTLSQPCLGDIAFIKSVTEIENIISYEVVSSDNRILSIEKLWHAIVKKIENATQDKSDKHFYSIDDHSYIISFDPLLIELQKNALKEESYKDVFMKLQCTIIDSLASSFPNSFYKKKQTDEESKLFDTLKEQRGRILIAQELAKQIKIVLKKDISSELIDLLHINNTGNLLNELELKQLISIEEKLIPYRDLANKAHSNAAKKIQKIYRKNKDKKTLMQQNNTTEHALKEVNFNSKEINSQPNKLANEEIPSKKDNSGKNLDTLARSLSLMLNAYITGLVTPQANLANFIFCGATLGISFAKTYQKSNNLLLTTGSLLAYGCGKLTQRILNNNFKNFFSSIKVKAQPYVQGSLLLGKLGIATTCLARSYNLLHQ